MDILTAFSAIIAMLVSIVSIITTLKKTNPEVSKLETDADRGQLELLNMYKENQQKDAKTIVDLQVAMVDLKRELALAREEIASLRREMDDIQKSSMVRYRAVMEVTPNATALINVDSARIIDVNDKAAQMYGFTRKQMEGINIADISAEPGKTLDTLIRRLTKVEKRYHKKKDGSVFPVTIKIYYYQEEDACYASVVVEELDTNGIPQTEE